MSLKVADISQFNSTITWSAVDVDGVIIRAGYRGYGTAGTLVTDTAFASHMQAATARSIPVGVYWLSQALSEAEAEAEADYLLTLLNGRTLAFPVYLDSEYGEPNGNGRADRISASRRTAYAIAFLERIRQAGYIPGVYASESWFKSNFILSQLVEKGYTLWVAKYASVSPSIGASYDAWQYTSSAVPSGFSGNTDLSHFYRDFPAEAANSTGEEDEDMTLETFTALMREYRKTLQDNDASSYSEDARTWAVNSGLIQGGTPDENGDPNYMWEDSMTREQLVTVLYRFAQMIGQA